MTAPTPQILSAELWNRLLGLSEDAKIELDKVIWQLRKLVKDRPADFNARVTLAYGLLLGGDRDGGMQHIEAARGLWWKTDGRAKYDFISLLVDVGELNIAQELFEIAIDHDFSQQNKIVHNSMCAYGLRSGNIEWFDRAIKLTGVQDDDGKVFVDNIIKHNLADEFLVHQNIVDKIIGPFSCTFNSAIGVDDSGQIIASVKYHTYLFGKDRLRLYKQIAEAKISAGISSISPFVSYGIFGPQIQHIEDEL